MTGRSGRRSSIDHKAVAAKARAERGVWQLAGLYPSAETGQSAARRIPRAERMRAYHPPGTFEAYSAPHEKDGATAVWVRYVAGLPMPEPRPSTMSYRVIDRGDGPGYTGVRIVTVLVEPECPRCGGPRGKPRNHRFCEDGAWYDVDKWENPCGHVDMYAAVLAEHRKRLETIERAEQQAAAHAAAAPNDAGEYTDAVALLNAAAAEVSGLRAKQAAAFLDTRGHHEAARRIQEEVASHPRMSARQAAVFLVELAAARAACTQCKDGRINYKARDGEFVSLPCPTCRREVVPVA
ncbi:hypothetical protein [Streptomyces sp. NPDC053560]|uniref:hypothetical protein n=1 Tax=Streptomyces sp. NPDC053560 TaxID=3365711 RepID=UPI0037CF99A7